MANTKKIDPNKLTLGLKKGVIKEIIGNPGIIETAIQQIHNVPASNQKKETVPEEPTRRTTIDIPESMHKQIKRRLVDKDTTMKDYVLELVKKDLGI